MTEQNTQIRVDAEMMAHLEDQFPRVQYGTIRAIAIAALEYTRLPSPIPASPIDLDDVGGGA